MVKFIPLKATNRCCCCLIFLYSIALDAIWLVKSGALALFTISVEHGTPKGRHRYLSTDPIEKYIHTLGTILETINVFAGRREPLELDAPTDPITSAGLLVMRSLS